MSSPDPEAQRPPGGRQGGTHLWTLKAWCDAHERCAAANSAQVQSASLTVDQTPAINLNSGYPARRCSETLHDPLKQVIWKQFTYTDVLKAYFRML
jgi:hypothetical protein